MLRRFIVRFILALFGLWLATTFLSTIHTDGTPTTLMLMALFVAAGEIIIILTNALTALLFFFIPRALRLFLLRMLTVAASAALVTGFSFGQPLYITVSATAFILSLLFLLPFAS